MKKIFSLILLLAVSFSMYSCKPKNREYDEYEVKLAAETLIKKSRALNDIYWGEGIGYYEDDNYADGYYYPADPMSLRAFGVETVEELKEKTEKVFSRAYCESIYDSSIVSPDDTDPSLRKRYYQGLECIMVYSRATAFLTDKVTYFYDTIEVTGSDEDSVFVNISVKVERDGKIQNRVIEISLVEEEDGWRIDTPTYIVYMQE